MRDLSEPRLMNFAWQNIQNYSIPKIAVFFTIPRGVNQPEKHLDADKKPVKKLDKFTQLKNNQISICIAINKFFVLKCRFKFPLCWISVYLTAHQGTVRNELWLSCSWWICRQVIYAHEQLAQRHFECRRNNWNPSRLAASHKIRHCMQPAVHITKVQLRNSTHQTVCLFPSSNDDWYLRYLNKFNNCYWKIAK